MRTTIEINDQLLREAKRRAAQEGRPLRSLIEEAIRAMIQTPATRGRSFRLQWRPEQGRIQPGVRLDDRRSLFDLMEGR